MVSSKKESLISSIKNAHFIFHKLVICVLIAIVSFRNSWASTACLVGSFALYAILEHLRRIKEDKLDLEKEKIKKLEDKIEALASIPIFMQGRK